MSPLISVILPVLDGAPDLDGAIASVLAQTLEDLELIVVDDGSADESPAIAARHAARDPRVRLIRLARDPRTVSGARADNVGQRQARGAFVSRMDQDDLLAPERLAAQVALMRERDLDVCGSQAEYCGAQAGAIWFPEDHAAIERELVFRPAMIHASQTTRAAVRQANPLDETTPAEDYEWQTRMAPSLRFGNAAETLVRYRVHPRQGSRRRRAQMLRDMARQRFAYFFRLFPAAGLDDFRAIQLVAARAPIAAAPDLERAGGWLARLADLPDPCLKRRMAARWAATCNVSTIEPSRLAIVRERFERRILADAL